MPDIQNASRNTERQIEFEVSLNWITKQRGVLSSGTAGGTISVATPAVFGGEGREWSPEHLFLGSISSCFMSTYLFFARKMGFYISRMECEVNGRVELLDGRYQFARIDVFPKIYVQDSSMAKALLALRKAEENCLVSNSIKTEIMYQGQVIESPNS
jgi:organic hydroperoxide reductase OsmC/OhrA